VPKRLSLDQIRKDLEAKKKKLDKEFEDKMRQAERKGRGDVERIKAQKNAKMAKIQEDVSKKTDAALKRHLGEERYKRLHELLLKRKRHEIKRLQQKERIKPDETEDYKTQISELDETDPKNLVWTYIINDKKNSLEAIERDTGSEISEKGW
jgi:hypothetical protein